MLNGSHNAKADRLFIAGQSSQESTLMVIVERTPQGITQFVAERANAGHSRNVGLDRAQRLLQQRRLGCPAFAVQEYSGIDIVEHLTDSVHSRYIVDSH